MSMDFTFDKRTDSTAHWIAPPPRPARSQSKFEAQAGEALFAQEQWAQASQRFIEAIRLQPENAYFHWAAAMSFWADGRMENAGKYLQSAVRLDPKYAPAQSWLGQWYLRHGMIDDALAASAKALGLAPDTPIYMAGRAWILEADGQLDASWELLRKLLDRNQMTPSLARLYGRLAPRYGQQEKALVVVLEMLRADMKPDKALSSLNFTAAYLLDHAGRYDEAFSYAARGNELCRSSQHDPVAQSRWIDRLIEYFTPDRMRCLPKAVHRSDKPVFIVGMPRSGTSLIEQILATHPAVHGAGELDFSHQVFVGMLGMLRANTHDYPGCLDKLSIEQADGMAQIYLEPFLALKPGATRITDKMPLNFLHLGLLAAVLPEARIIHCRRDPMDTSLSCFMTDFNTGHEFKYDLTHLGLFYRDYHRLMEHWKKTIDLPILEVNYEDVIANTEAQSRRMVEFLGLPWNDRCLRFYETKRAVVTSSVQQVRQPIYGSSMQRWRHYEKHLAPLKAALRTV
jgi:tetratricopeptide (TPR) repeat protein